MKEMRIRAADLSQQRVSVHSLRGPDRSPGAANVAAGWTGVALGLAAALWIGLWAFAGPFDPPAGFEAYDALPRRLLRLGHIAAVMVGVLNVLVGHELPRLDLPLAWKRAASRLALLAWPGLSLVLCIAAFVPAVKYALPVGACALTASVTIVAAGAWRTLRRPTSLEDPDHA